MKLKVNESQTCWVTSDLHFGHKNIIRYSKRPFKDVEDMNEQLIQRWNDRVSPDDIVFNLGDFAFLKPEQIAKILSRLNGKQYFVMGNHDQCIISPVIKETGKIIKFFDRIDLRYKGHHIVMHHYAQRVWDKSHYGSLHLFGHSHGSLPGIGRSVDVGVDSSELQTDYAPLLLDDVIEYLRCKDIHRIDHH